MEEAAKTPFTFTTNIAQAGEVTALLGQARVLT
jgi:hypothetical protein